MLVLKFLVKHLKLALNLVGQACEGVADLLSVVCSHRCLFVYKLAQSTNTTVFLTCVVVSQAFFTSQHAVCTVVLEMRFH